MKTEKAALREAMNILRSLCWEVDPHCEGRRILGMAMAHLYYNN